MGLAGTSKNYQGEKGGRFEQQLALSPRRLYADVAADNPRTFRETYRKAPEAVSVAPSVPVIEPEPRSARGTEPAGDRASKEREEAPVKEDTPPIAAVKKEGRGRPRKIAGSPWEVEGVSRRTWERRQAKAKSEERNGREKPDGRTEEGGSG
jgi:hypothetical protein